MEITQVELYEIEIPPIPPIARYFPKIYDITLCRIQTDEGLEGWGEFQGIKSTGQEQADALVGEDPLAIYPYARPDAFTCALLDIAGQAYGYVLRSPHAHAVIRSIDTAEAASMPGVVAVLSGDDLAVGRLYDGVEEVGPRSELALPG